MYKNTVKSNAWDSGMTFVKGCGKVSDFVVYIHPRIKGKIDILMKEFPNIEWLAYFLGDINWEEEYAYLDDIHIPDDQTISTATVDNVKLSGEVKTVGVIHSHHKMGATFSGTDWEYINKNNDVSIVVAHNGMSATVRVKTSCGCYAHITPRVEVDWESLVEKDAFISEVREKIKERKVPNKHTYGKYHYKSILEEIEKSQHLDEMKVLEGREGYHYDECNTHNVSIESEFYDKDEAYDYYFKFGSSIRYEDGMYYVTENDDEEMYDAVEMDDLRM